MTRRYTIDHTFFSSIDTEDKAYILGFIAADGCVGLGTLRIGLHPRDTDILEKIRARMQSNAPIVNTKSGKWPMARWSISSVQLAHDLIAAGITPRKSLTLQFPTLTPELERHYIRGLWDGDGFITKHDFGLVGSIGTIEGVNNVLVRETGMELRLVNRGNIRELRGYRCHSPALHWLYTQTTIALQRKMDAFQIYWPLPDYPPYKAKILDLICAKCGKAFQRKAKDVKHALDHTFCSKHCAGRPKGTGTVWQITYVTCSYCGKLFIRRSKHVSHTAVHAYCSIPCRNEGRRGFTLKEYRTK
jgi:hypothetical protein